MERDDILFWVQWLINLVVVPLLVVAVRNFTVIRRLPYGQAPRLDPDAFALAIEPLMARISVLEAMLDELRAQNGRYNERISFIERRFMSDRRDDA